MNSEESRGLDETLDTLFEGRLRVYQSRTGYRFSLDAVLLVHFAAIREGDKAADLGAGNGAIALMLAYLHPCARITAIEIQPAMIQRARRNVVLNGLAQRISIVSGDVRAPGTLPGAGSFDIVVCNPPYRAPLSGRVSPNPEKRIARHEFEGALTDFLEAGSVLLKRRGRLALVYPAFRAVDVLTFMRAAGIEPRRVRTVHSSSDSAASLILAEGVKGGKCDLAVQAPLMIYDQPRRYSSEVAAMLAGELKKRE